MKLEAKLAEQLTRKKNTLAIAESCSAGLLGDRISSVSNCSLFFKGGIIAYSNDIKQSLCKVKPQTFETHGAVSQETAIELANNIRKIFKSTYGVSITGIAGPSGGTKKKPVGLAYIAFSSEKESLCLKCIFEGDRKTIKKAATTQALQTLLEFTE